MIKKEADVFGLLFLSGCAKIYRTPLLNILVSGKNTCRSLEIVYCKGRVSDGGGHMEPLYVIDIWSTLKIDPNN